MSSLTQFENRRGGEMCDVVVGFDFGTSCTKVVLRTPDFYNGRACAVEFGEAAHDSSPYLLPSALWVGPGDRISLSPTKNGTHLRELKRHLMREEPLRSTCGRTFDAETIAVAFVAGALRKARRWFLRRQRDLYEEYTLRWSLNIGMPSMDYTDPTLCDAYRRIAHAAWWLSVQHPAITIGHAQKALRASDQWDHFADGDGAEIKTIPEVAAEVAGYAWSDLRREGLHVLVDIGAGTLDVCGFILHEKEGDDRYELLTADVRDLGAVELHHHRIAQIRKETSGDMDDLPDEWDPVASIPDIMPDYLPPDMCRSINEEFGKRCSQMIWKTIVDLRKRRDPNSQCWKSEIPMFVAGGGSAMTLYQDVIEDVSDAMPKYAEQCTGIRQLSMVKPDNLVASVDDQEYHRLAVASGLSYPEVDIGKISRPSESDAITAHSSSNWQSGHVTKDMV